MFTPLMIRGGESNGRADALPVLHSLHGLHECIGGQILSRSLESFNEGLGKHNPGNIEGRPPLFGLIFLVLGAIFNHQRVIRIRRLSEVGMNHSRPETFSDPHHRHPIGERAAGPPLGFETDLG